MRNTHRQHIDRQARYWLIRMTSGCAGPEDQARFAAWKAEHSAHEQAYAYLSALDTVVGECAVAVAGRVKNNASTQKRVHPTVRFAWVAAAAGLIIAVVLGLNSSMFKPVPDGTIYATQAGELREITLQDGSAVHLSGATRIEATYTGQRRDVRLIEGEALFSVRHSPERPFIVYVNGTAVRAVGTAFDVHKQPTGLAVSVIEGVVSVSRNINKPGQTPGVGAQPARPVIIEKGQKISYKTGDVEGTIAYAPLEKFATWRRGVLEFDQVELESVIADINRYAQGKIIIASDDIRHLPVTAVFSIGDFQEVADVLPHILPVQATMVSASQIVLSRRRP